ncbi:MAG: type I restriction enzyme HsdR N-terminal domain-containing protein [Rhizobacter sp.]|nr:type I restriction enzyme HsdR N-terminal domain-containing protein [Ferruginibacter sp.]
MIKIIYPDKKPAIKTTGEKEFIFCMIRKKWMQLTPEEWVRQNTLLYLTQSLQYPASLIAVEKKIVVGDLHKRFDIVVYKNEKPFMLLECKEMNVPITQKTLDQVIRYNQHLQASFFIITNGSTCYGFKNESGVLAAIEVFPVF